MAKFSIAIVTILVALIAIGAALFPSTSITTNATSGSTTQSTRRTASTTAPQAVATGALTLQVIRATVDQTKTDTQSGYTIYIYDVSITNTDSTSHLISMAAFTLISSTNAVYQYTIDLAMSEELPSITLSQGQHRTGQVAFQVRNGDQPAKLEYSLPVQGIDEFVANLPQPSRWVSSVALAQATMKGSATASDFLVSVDIQNATKTGIYFSTDTISVRIAVSPLVNMVAGMIITSVTVANEGFAVSTTIPALPETLSTYEAGEEFYVMVNLTLPQASVSVDTLNLTLTTA